LKCFYGKISGTKSVVFRILNRIITCPAFIRLRCSQLMGLKRWCLLCVQLWSSLKWFCPW
jgi:hypothetical protein